MSETAAASSAKQDLIEIAKALSDVTRKLGEIARVLAAQVGENAPAAEALAESEKDLDRLSQHLSALQAPQTQRHAQAEARRALRAAILAELLQGGPALPMELAASVLALVEDIQPILAELETEGLVRIRRVAGADVIELTPRGREEARRLNGP